MNSYEQARGKEVAAFAKEFNDVPGVDAVINRLIPAKNVGLFYSLGARHIMDIAMRLGRGRIAAFQKTHIPDKASPQYIDIVLNDGKTAVEGKAKIFVGAKANYADIHRAVAQATTRLKASQSGHQYEKVYIVYPDGQLTNVRGNISMILKPGIEVYELSEFARLFPRIK